MNVLRRAAPALFAAALSALFVACRREDPPAAAEETPREYEVRGVVRKLDPARRSLVVKHEAIPGFMEAMTMPFDVKDTNELAAVKPGDHVAFRMLVTTNDGWIDRIRVLPPPTGAAPEEPVAPRLARQVPELRPGDTLPDYVLTNELGRTIRLSDFRGKALAFSFIFTRCPYPDFCPRISDHLSRTLRKLDGTPGAPTNFHLLSISFDPAHDTPAMLLAYAERYAYDPRRWSLASGGWDQLEPLTGHFGLQFARDVPPERLEHNLRTVVVTPAGKIHAILPSNEWEVDDLVKAVTEAAAAR